MSSVAIKNTVVVALSLVTAAIVALAVLAPVQAQPPYKVCPTQDMQCPSRDGVMESVKES